MIRSRSSSSVSNSKSKRNKKSQQNHKERHRSRSQQQNHKPYEQNTCLYIGNLDKKCTEEQLKKICLEYGEYEYCYIVFEPNSLNDRNRDSKISRGYGFVRYIKGEDSYKARLALDKKQILSRKINVEVSNRARPRESTPGQYLGRRRSPPRRQMYQYRRRSYSRSSSSDHHRRRKHQKERKHKDRDREHKRRQRSRSVQKKHRKRDSRSHSPKK